MDTSALDYLDTPEDKPVANPQEQKHDAFYASSLVSRPEDLESTYSQVLGDLGRFNKSPVIDDIKAEWKKQNEGNIDRNISDVLLNPALPLEKKGEIVKGLLEEKERDPTPKEIFTESLEPKKKPLELTVIGGENVLKSWTDEREIPDSIADAILRFSMSRNADYAQKAKDFLNKFEVKDWVPLIGGTGVGDLMIGDAPEGMEAIAKHGLLGAFEYTPVVAGGRANPLNYKMKKEVVEAIFTHLDAAGIAEMGVVAARAAVKAATKQALNDLRIEPSFDPKPQTKGELKDLSSSAEYKIRVEYKNSFNEALASNTKESQEALGAWSVSHLDQIRNAAKALWEGDASASTPKDIEMLKEMYNSWGPFREKLRKYADSEGYITAYRGINTKTLQEGSSIDSWTLSENIAKESFVGGVAGKVFKGKIHIDDIVAGGNKGEEELLVRKSNKTKILSREHELEEEQLRIDTALYYKGSEEVPVGETIWFDTTSPVGVVSRIDKPAAATALAKVVKSPTIADGMGTSPAGIVHTNLMFKTDPEITKIYPDISEELARIDAEFVHHFDLGKVDPLLFDTTAISKDVNKHFDFTRQAIDGVALNAASSYLDPIGRALRGKLVYGKEVNKGFEDTLEALRARDDLGIRIAEQFAEEIGDVPYDKLSGKDKWKLQQRVIESITPIQDPQSGEIFLHWPVNRFYNPRIDTSMGTAAVEAHWMGKDATTFANTGVGKWIYNPATRLSEAYSSGMALADIRGTNIDKILSKTMRDVVLTSKSQKELLQAIYVGEEKGVEFTVSELKEMFPDLSPSKFKSLVRGYAGYRRIADYAYTIANDIYRSQKITAGYEGLYTGSGKNTNSLGYLVKRKDDTVENGVLIKGKKELKTASGADIQEVYDFTPTTKLDEATGKEVSVDKGVVSLKGMDVENMEIYRLDRPIKKDGKSYEYAIGVQSGPVKKDLLPRIKGYYPHINMEHYFVKAVPKKLVLSGVEVPDDGTKAVGRLYKDHSSTVGYGRTRKQAEEMAIKLAKENPDGEFTYIAVADRSSFDDNLMTAMSSIKYAQDVAKSRGTDRLLNVNGVPSRLENPSVALKKRGDQLAKLYAWKDIDFEFRRNFLKEFGHLTDNVFPENASEISIGHLPDTPDNQASLVRARNLYEQYAKQQSTTRSLTDQFWQSGVKKIADYIEDIAPRTKILEPIIAKVADKAQEVALTREPVTSTALKVATVSYMHLKPIRQWVIQPTPLLELYAMAGPVGNTRFLVDAPTLVPMLFTHNALKAMGDGVVAQSMREAFYTTSYKTMGMSEKEFKEILQAFDDSGIANSIDKMAVLDGVFKSSTDELTESTTKHFYDKAMGAAKGVALIPKKVGYDSAELLNQIGAWVYARSDFMMQNPKAKWNDPTNLAMIHSKQWGVSNSMSTKADVFNYQTGGFRFLTQFSAYTNKAMIQPFVSKSLRKEEAMALAAVRLAAYGKKGIVGVPLGVMAAEYIRNQTNPSDPKSVEERDNWDKFFEFADRGMQDAFINQFLRYVNQDGPDGPKTDLLFTDSTGPAGELGIPMGELGVKLWQFVRSETTAKQVAPFLGASSSILDTVNTLHTIFKSRQYETMDKDAALRYLGEASRIIPGLSDYEMGMAMLHHRKMVERTGNVLDMEITTAEALAKFAGVQNNRMKIYNEVNIDEFRRGQQIKESVRKAVKDLHAIESVYDGLDDENRTLTHEEAAKKIADYQFRVTYVASLYADTGNEDEYFEELDRQLSAEGRRGLAGLVARMDKRYYKEYDKIRRESMERLNTLCQTSSKQNCNTVKQMYIDLGVNP